MTPERLAEIKARAEKATPGPWRSEPNDDGYIMQHNEAFGWHVLGTAHYGTKCTAEFIAHARTDVPDLLDALEAVQRERDSALSDGSHQRNVALAVENAALRQKLQEARTLLLNSGPSWGNVKCCPDCDAILPGKHEPDCAVGAWVAGLDGISGAHKGTSSPPETERKGT